MNENPFDFDTDLESEMRLTGYNERMLQSFEVPDVVRQSLSRAEQEIDDTPVIQNMLSSLAAAPTSDHQKSDENSIKDSISSRKASLIAARKKSQISDQGDDISNIIRQMMEQEKREKEGKGGAGTGAGAGALKQSANEKTGPMEKIGGENSSASLQQKNKEQEVEFKNSNFEANTDD